MTTTQKIIMGTGAAVIAGGIITTQVKTPPTPITAVPVTIKSTTPDPKTITIKPNGAASTEIRAAVLKNGVVQTIVIVPPGWPNVPNAWVSPSGTTVLLSNEAQVGDTYDGPSLVRQVNVAATTTATSTP